MRSHRDRMSPMLWCLLLIMALGWIFPLIWTALTSFRPEDQSVAVGSIIATNWTLSNYVRAWNSAPFGTYMINTVILVTGILSFQLVTATLAAFAFARFTFKGRDLLFLLFLLQMMIPVEALVVPNYLTIQAAGLFDTRIAMMLPYIATAFGTFLLRQTFKQVPKELQEAAVIDGCSILQTLWHVFIPVARPTMVAFGLVSVSYHWNNFFWPVIISNSTDVRPLTVGLALFAKATESGADWALVTAGTIIVILPLLILFIIFQRQFISSFMQTGIK